MKQVAITDIFTRAEIVRARILNNHGKIQKEIVEPALPRINGITDQENDAGYWTYALEHAISQMRERIK